MTKRWITPANALTAARLASAPVLVLAIRDGCYEWAGPLFAFAVLTDLLDGRIARRRGEVTRLGGLFDHGVDATFVTLGLAALALQARVPTALPILIALAFAQYAIDSGGATRPLRGSALGRWNGIAYYALLGTAVIRDALGLSWPSDVWIGMAGWVLVCSTLISMYQRALEWLRHRKDGPAH